MRKITAEEQIFSETQASLLGEAKVELLAKFNEPEKLPRVESIFFCNWKIA
jgi:hypothetical protein